MLMWQTYLFRKKFKLSSTRSPPILDLFKIIVELMYVTAILKPSSKQQVAAMEKKNLSRCVDFVWTLNMQIKLV